MEKEENFLRSLEIKDLKVRISTEDVQILSKTPLKTVDRVIVLEAVNVFPSGYPGPKPGWTGAKSVLVAASDLKEYNIFRFKIPKRSNYNTIRFGLYSAAKHMGMKVSLYHGKEHVYFRLWRCNGLAR